MKETTHHGDFCKQSSQQHIVTALCAEKYETETEEAENEHDNQSYVKHYFRFLYLHSGFTYKALLVFARK